MSSETHESTTRSLNSYDGALASDQPESTSRTIRRAPAPDAAEGESPADGAHIRIWVLRTWGYLNGDTQIIGIVAVVWTFFNRSTAC